MCSHKFALKYNVDKRWTFPRFKEEEEEEQEEGLLGPLTALDFTSSAQISDEERKIFF